MIRWVRALVHGDPRLMRSANGWLTVFWIVMIPVSILAGWVHSVTYVAALSLWALVSSHLSAYQSARAGEDVVEAMVDDDRIPTEPSAPWVKRDPDAGQFARSKKAGGPFRGARRE